MRRRAPVCWRRSLPFIPRVSTRADCSIEAAVGRACIKDGGICTIILGCTPPKSLSFCLASTVSGTDAPRCVECAETTWLVDGKCKPKLYCRGSYYAEGEVAALGKCTCRRLLENGGVDKNCGRCEVRKEPALAKMCHRTP